MKIKLFFIYVFLGLLFSCNGEKVEPVTDLTGQWEYEYEILNDGTKNYDNPYALLEFEYSDGFFLNENNTGHRIWFGKINRQNKFEWWQDDNRLKIQVTYSNGNKKEFKYFISNLMDNSMDFQTPKGRKYHMLKQ